MNDLADTDRDAADALLEMDDAATQRRFVRAHEQGEVSTDELSTAVKRYDDLDASGTEAADDVIATTGDDGAELLANADGETVRILADGSGDVDQSFRRAVARSADGDSIDSYDQLDRAVKKVDDLDATRQRRAKQLIADTDGAGVELVDELDSGALNNILDYDGEGARGMRRTLARQHESGNIDTGEIETFSTDLEELRNADVDGIEHVIEDDIADSSTNNVRGAMYEFRVANGYVDDVDDIAEIGWTRQTVEFDELSSDQIDQIIKEMDFADSESRADKVDVIQNALNPDSLGRANLETELDVLKRGDEYVEAKSGSVEYANIQDKIVRYKAHQLAGNLDSKDTMVVVAKRESEFIDGNTGGPNKVGRLIKNTRGVSWDTLEE